MARFTGTSHVISLRSAVLDKVLQVNAVKQDSLAEQLEVVWEIEPGACVIEPANLPVITGQDNTTAYGDTLPFAQPMLRDDKIVHDVYILKLEAIPMDWQSRHSELCTSRCAGFTSVYNRLHSSGESAIKCEADHTDNLFDNQMNELETIDV